jgi:flagellar biosynthesis/type III secretory pathway protein FliH
VSEFKPLFPEQPATGFTPKHLTAQHALEAEAAAAEGDNPMFKMGLAPDSVAKTPEVAPTAPGESPPRAENLETADSPTEAPPLDLEELIAQARAEGAEEGRQQAAAELAQLSSDLDTLNSGLEQLRTLHSESLKAAAADIGVIVTSLMERLFYDNLVLHPRALAELVDGALNAMPEDQKVWLTAHPDHVERLGNLLTTGREIEIIEDQTIQAGFRIHNKYASIDSTLTKLLEGIDAAVQQWQKSQ